MRIKDKDPYFESPGGVPPVFNSTTEEEMRKFLRPGVDRECVEILFHYLVAPKFGVWEQFESDVRGFSEARVRSRMEDHIGLHVWANVRGDYGLPKMDLGIAFWFGKLDTVTDVLLKECMNFTPSSTKEKDSLTRMQNQLPRYYSEVFGVLDRNTQDVNALIKQGYNLDLRFGSIQDQFLSGDNYSFFVFLLSFTREEDGRSLMPAYKRRMEFLDFFESNIRPSANCQGGGAQNKEMKGGGKSEVIPETVVDKEMILGLADKDIVSKLYTNRWVIDDLSPEQVILLMEKITSEGANYRPGQGDTQTNFILELLIHALKRKIQPTPEDGIIDPGVAYRIHNLLGPQSRMAVEIFPPIISARIELLGCVESPKGDPDSAPF